MTSFRSLIPIFVFIGIFIGSGAYFTYVGHDHAFYQLSPIAAIIPGIIVAWLLHKGTQSTKMHDFLDGMRHRDIMTMCVIFLLAGAFSHVTSRMGSIDATVHFALSFIPSHFLLMGIFLVAAFVSTSVGTSMGAIATVAPIGFALSQKVGLPAPLCVATVVGGAMFGDNLSVVSDTTIAAIASQEADLKLKLKLNSKIALIASILTIALLAFNGQTGQTIDLEPYNLVYVTPYILLIILSSLGMNVLISLVTCILYAGGVAMWGDAAYTPVTLAQHSIEGFANMHEIMVLSLLVGGLSGLSGRDFTHTLAQNLSHWIDKRKAGPKLTQLIMAKVVSVCDILLANNTIAIIVVGDMVRVLGQKQKIPAHVRAVWIDTFSCVCQGIIPHGAQILLASSIAHVSPLEVIPHVYYCFILGSVSIAYILLKKESSTA